MSPSAGAITGYHAVFDVADLALLVDVKMENSTIHNPVRWSLCPSKITALSNLKSTLSLEYVISYPMSTRSLIDNSEVFNSAKMCARNKCPDGSVKYPMCDERIVWPFATVTPILEVWSVARTSDTECKYLIAMYLDQ
jgi:hypothetical protein